MAGVNVSLSFVRLFCKQAFYFYFDRSSKLTGADLNNYCSWLFLQDLFKTIKMFFSGVSTSPLMSCFYLEWKKKKKSKKPKFYPPVHRGGPKIFWESHLLSLLKFWAISTLNKFFFPNVIILNKDSRPFEKLCLPRRWYTIFFTLLVENFSME